MSALQNNVDALRTELTKQEALLEHQKREAKEKEERSWKYNMDILDNIYEDKKLGADTIIDRLERQKKRHYEVFPFDTDSRRNHIDTQISQHKKSYEQDAALCHLFHHLGDELWRIECKIQQNFNKLDERITHIEEFLDMMK